MMKWFAALTFSIVLAATPALHAGRSISSLPHIEDFRTNAWLSDLRWISQGAAAQHMVGVNWDGGNAARFWLPTGGQGYSGLGQFSLPPGVTHVNIRFVYQWGSTFIADDEGLGPKHLILKRSTNADGDRAIVQQHAFGPNQWDLGIGNNILPVYPDPRVWDYSQHTGQFVCFEFEMVVGGQLRVWITKRNDANWNERLLVSVPTNNSNGTWSLLDIIGAFGGPGTRGSADPNAWFQISNLEISNRYIGPPAGFVSGSSGSSAPAPPTSVRIIQ